MADDAILLGVDVHPRFGWQVAESGGRTGDRWSSKVCGEGIRMRHDSRGCNPLDAVGRGGDLARRRDSVPEGPQLTCGLHLAPSVSVGVSSSLCTQYDTLSSFHCKEFVSMFPAGSSARKPWPCGVRAPLLPYSLIMADLTSGCAIKGGAWAHPFGGLGSTLMSDDH